MFAFVIFDKNLGKVFLARDRVGIKPLYFGKVDKKVFWGTELKPIKEMFKSSLKMDYTAIYDFLTYLYVPTPKTLYLNVNKLEPGKFLSIDVNSLNISKHSYWKLKVQNLKPSYKEAKDRVFDIILRNVEQQMMSDGCGLLSKWRC